MKKSTQVAPRKSACQKILSAYPGEMEFIHATFSDDQPESLVAALAVISRVRGMTKLAKASHISRDGLYKAFSPRGNPSLRTVITVLGCLGYRLKIIPRK